MTAKLTLSYEFSSNPDDDFGWLAVAVHTDAFIGRGGFWVQWQDLVEMVPKLDTYPFTAANPLVKEWGQCNSDGSNYEIIIGIIISSANKTGDLDVAVRLTHCHNTRQHCQVLFQTNYPDVAKFAGELKAVMDQRQDDATLLGRSVT